MAPNSVLLSRNNKNNLKNVGHAQFDEKKGEN